MDKLVKRLRKAFPDVRFVPGETSFWSPRSATVSYAEGGEHAAWTLLHEASHALLGHTNYTHDLDLLLLEVAAWEKAKELGPRFNLSIDNDYIQTCLDTYRDWLHSRSTCPTCHTVSLQSAPQEYQCHNCSTIWHVSASRFCRPYRRIKKSPA